MASLDTIQARTFFTEVCFAAIDAGHIVGEIEEQIAGRVVGRTNAEDITLFKLVGMAVQDAAAAQVAVSRALTAGIGQHVHWE